MDRTLDFMGEFIEENGTSMLYDRLVGNALEWDVLDGTVVGRAEAHRIDVPLRRTVAALLQVLFSARTRKRRGALGAPRPGGRQIRRRYYGVIADRLVDAGAPHPHITSVPSQRSQSSVFKLTCVDWFRWDAWTGFVETV